jgi:hypothetical protein
MKEKIESDKIEEIEGLIEWAKNQERCGQEVIEDMINMGWGDMADVQQEKEIYRKIAAALQELLDKAKKSC